MFGRGVEMMDSRKSPDPDPDFYGDTFLLSDADKKEIAMRAASIREMRQVALRLVMQTGDLRNFCRARRCGTNA